MGLAAEGGRGDPWVTMAGERSGPASGSRGVPRALVLGLLAVGLVTMLALPTGVGASPTGTELGMRGATPVVSGGSASPDPAQSNASPHWTQLHPLTHPSGRSDAGMVYDAADGYVILFGGWRGGYCLNDTWTYRDGVWTNLSIPGPHSCHPAMAYDAADGYVVAYLNFSRYGFSSSQPPPQSHTETWIFAHGRWTELHIAEPPVVDFALATYDAASRAVLLYGFSYIETGDGNGTNGTNQTRMVEETWAFSGGEWHHVQTSYAPVADTAVGHSSQLVYDAADGYALMLASSRFTYDSYWLRDTWTFSGGNWTNQGAIPTALRRAVNDGLGNPSMTFDAKDGYVLLYSALAWTHGPWDYTDEGVTWSYGAGTWTNESIPSPPGRSYASMTFDEGDGYVLFFGGFSGPLNDSPTNLSPSTPYWSNYWDDWNDTWIYTVPPVAVSLAATAAPSIICSGASPNCGAGTEETRVSLTVRIDPVPATPSWGEDTGNGSVLYGPFYWLAAPTLTFLGWRNLTPAPNLGVSVECAKAGGASSVCPRAPEIQHHGGVEVLTWNWSAVSAGAADALREGDTWQIEFNVQALGPPYGLVPVDSCVTASCLGAGTRAVGGLFSAFGFSPSGNATRLSESLPLVRVTVLPPAAETDPAPTPPPPPPPPSVGVPLPSPSLPTPAPAPVATPVVVSASVGASLSLVAAAAGILGAGAVGIVVRPGRQEVRLAVRIGGRPRRRGPVRGAE